MSRTTRAKDKSEAPVKKSGRRGTRDINPAPKGKLLGLQQAAGNRATGRLLRGGTAPSIVNQVLSSTGQPLTDNVRSLMESRFGHDFEDVRIHTGAQASESANAVNAAAYTVGRNIVFGADQYAPSTQAGQQTLAHELAHVVQNSRVPSSTSGKFTISEPGSETERAADAAAEHVGAGRLSDLQPAARPGQLSRKPPLTPNIPQELQQSIDLSRLSLEELQARHDLIISTLENFDESNTDTQSLELEAGLIGEELMRRQALSAGRTFGAAEVERMKRYFVKNTQKAKPCNCIDTMNNGLQELYGDKKLAIGDSVDRTMRALQRSERAGDEVVVQLEDERGISRSGALAPKKVHGSVWDAILRMNGGDVGWSVFGMGLADYSHSIVLTLDNTLPGQPVIYWSDQWKEKEGWKKLDKDGLDAEVVRVTKIIWDKYDEKHKPNLKVTLWRLKRNVSTPVPLKSGK